MAYGKVLDVCPNCGKKDVRHAGRGLCGACYSKKRREDPEKRKKDLETSQRWKKRHPGYEIRGRQQDRRHPPEPPKAEPSAIVFCFVCGNPMLDPDETGMCGFCKIELEPQEKLKMILFPSQDEKWQPYFSSLDNGELAVLIRQARLEQARRVAEHMKAVQTRNEDLYGKEPPPHHRRCPDCNELITNCRCESHAAA